MGQNPSNVRYVVVDNAFNRAWYPELIGNVYKNVPPSYVAVRTVYV